MTTSPTLELGCERAIAVQAVVESGSDDEEPAVSATVQLTIDGSGVCSSRFCCNKYNVIRFLLSLIVLMLALLFLLYAYGQLFSLKLADYYCSPKSPEDIRQHSLANNLNGGTTNGCWTTNSYRLDINKAFAPGSTSLSGYTATRIILNASIVVKMLMFLCVASFLFFGFGYFIWVLISDCRTFERNHWQRHLSAAERQAQRGFRRGRCQALKQCRSSYIKCRSKYFGLDSPVWVVTTILREAVEIVVVSIVWLQYGGAQTPFLYYFHGDDRLIMAEHPQFVLTFAIFLVCNCCFTGILWFGYLFAHATFNGPFMRYSLTFVDCIFDTFVTISPLLLLGSDSDFNTAAATIGDNSNLIFMSVFIPSVSLSYKMYRGLKISTKYARTQWRAQTMGIDQPDRQSSESPSSQDDAPAAQKCSSICYGDKYFDEPKAEDPQRLQKANVLRLRRFFIFCWSAFLCLYGVGVAVYTTVHFQQSIHLCNDISHIDLNQYPEMKLWEHCTFKVYPFSSAYGRFQSINALPCNCRTFLMIDSDVLQNIQYLHEQSHAISSLFHRFYMLESAMIQCDRAVSAQCQNIFALDLVSYPPNSDNLRALHLDAITKFNISNDTNLWPKLEILHMEISEISKSILYANQLVQWTNMQHFYLMGGQMYTMDPLCNMKHLIFAQLVRNTILTIPSCISQELAELQVLDMLWNRLETLDVNLFGMPSLKKLSIVEAYPFRSHLQPDRFGTEPFAWRTDEGITYSLLGSNVCEQYYSYDGNTSSPYAHVFAFLQNTSACIPQCGDADSDWRDRSGIAKTSDLHYSDSATLPLSILRCDQYALGDGVCDPTCDSFDCRYDNGDCIQLCPCNDTLLYNEECDELCNVPECQYDLYVCSDANNTACEERTKCHAEWIGDGMCDDLCREQELCDYDGGDCECGVDGWCSHLWEMWSLGSSTIANDFLMDRDEFCIGWTFLGADTYFSWLGEHNCSSYFDIVDLDKNDMLAANEFLSTIVAFDDQYSDLKYSQINCSSCAPDLAAFYGENYEDVIDEIRQNYATLF